MEINKVEVLAEYLEISPEEVSESTYDDSTFEANGGEWLVLTDEEATAKAKDYIRDTLWAFNASFVLDNTKGIIQDNFCELEEALREMQSKLCESANPIILALIGGEECLDEFVDSAVYADGRGHFLSSYDGKEIEFTVTTQVEEYTTTYWNRQSIDALEFKTTFFIYRTN